MTFELTAKQDEARRTVLSGVAVHICLFGGSRSGKTFLLVRQIVLRALKASGSRHAIFRFRFNAIKASIVMDTFPKVMGLVFPGVQYTINKTDWFVEFANGAQIWFAGLDDKERTEKILGMEFATIYFNETSQIPYASINIAITRLAQKVTQDLTGEALKPRCFYDLNPSSKAHWSYKLFVLKVDPDSKQPLNSPDHYVSFQINPVDNVQNLSDSYLSTLQSMSARMRQRFLDGKYADATPNALFAYEDIEAFRLMKGSVPELIRVVVGVDPSGASDDNDDTHNDDIGIVVGGLGIDGRGYLLEDCTVNAGPRVWGAVAASAYDRHAANCVVGEVNFGGGMVEHVIQTARPRTPFKRVTASRGKHVRAEPFSALYEQGKIKHVGYFPELEDEMCAFSTTGYLGGKSPNRADAWFWVLTELFSGIVSPRKMTIPFVPQITADQTTGY
jgi:phage terminase large subunit-like protein